MIIPRIENMQSPQTGEPVANQFIISINSVGTFFKSYDSIIALKSLDGVFLDSTYWNYSKTTAKYRSIFLNESTKETQKKIDSGEYTLKDLNA